MRTWSSSIRGAYQTDATRSATADSTFRTLHADGAPVAAYRKQTVENALRPPGGPRMAGPSSSPVTPSTRPTSLPRASHAPAWPQVMSSLRLAPEIQKHVPSLPDMVRPPAAGDYRTDAGAHRESGDGSRPESPVPRPHRVDQRKRLLMSDRTCVAGASPRSQQHPPQL